MIEFKDLKVDNFYKCLLTKEFALREQNPKWEGKTVELKFTGIVFRSEKNKEKYFCYQTDVEPIEEVLFKI